ncbi:class I adenylate-forming enzyme family protein [Cumulibacter manganitolerans]|uniref:class I adenylate-forming enzyme family protein n=1 Tax=Cumulibacter manganitolerans TaxID=1884992 RepID=UPI0012962CD3|nr:AMP-binding protein [Cumulibacter manganitolerans]
MTGEHSAAYAARPWLALYDEGVSAETAIEFTSGLDMLQQAVRRSPDRAALYYLDRPMTFAELDRHSDAFAVALHSEHGVTRGDRVMLQLQNMPAFLIAQYAAWKLGAIVVPVNPMFKTDELLKLASDAQPKVLVQLDSLYDALHEPIEALGTAIVTASGLDYCNEWPTDRLGEMPRLEPDSAGDLGQLCTQYAGRQPEPVTLSPDDTAYLVYTSGTTGPPKGAMNLHRAVVFNSENYRAYCHLDETDVCLAIAPLFHVTGLIAHVGVCALLGMPMALGYRFDPVVMCRLIERYRCTWVMGSITAYISILNEPSTADFDLSTLSKLWSGGQAVSPATVDQLEGRLGAYVHNLYGLTETTSESHAVPAARKAPIDPKSGALSVGPPVPGFECRVTDEDGVDVAVGEVGEIVMRSPAVVPGYWNKPEESAKAIRDGWLHTGDVGFMDADGWFYIVDRMKDLIVASGFKIWPREVEEVLYKHPAVREAAVIGVPDDYRGETVAAFVSLKPGTSATPEELQAFCKERLAAYKYPRTVEIIDEVPKNASGKIMRRELRR